MQFYLLLAALTIVIGTLAVMLWRQTRSFAILMGVGFLYFWSLYGGWYLIYDLRGGDSGMHYHYLFEKMFPIELDRDYLSSTLYLGLFVIAVEVTLLNCVRVQPAPQPLPADRLIHISHSKLIAICAVCGITSYWLISEGLEFAIVHNISVYRFTQGADAEVETISWFSLHATLNRLALFPAAIGFAVLVSGPNVRLARGPGGAAALLGYAALLSGMFVFCLVLGNKNELFVALILGLLFYLMNSLRPRRACLVAIGGVALFAFAVIDMVRGYSLSDMGELVNVEDLSEAILRITSSNEAFAGHMSMYGCVHYEVPITYGSSLLSLATSIVPRSIWPNRPPDIYTHYAESVRAIAGQGYSINHATGWYLNFGVFGVLVGGVTLGWIWSQLLLGLSRIHLYRKPAARLFFSFAALSLSAYIAPLVRAGPEVYKGVVIDGFLVPFTVLWLAQTEVKRTAVSRDPLPMRHTLAPPMRPEQRKRRATVNSLPASMSQQGFRK